MGDETFVVNFKELESQLRDASDIGRKYRKNRKEELESEEHTYVTSWSRIRQEVHSPQQTPSQYDVEREAKIGSDIKKLNELNDNYVERYLNIYERYLVLQDQYEKLTEYRKSVADHHHIDQYELLDTFGKHSRSDKKRWNLVKQYFGRFLWDFATRLDYPDIPPFNNQDSFVYKVLPGADSFYFKNLSYLVKVQNEIRNGGPGLEKEKDRELGGGDVTELTRSASTSSRKLEGDEKFRMISFLYARKNVRQCLLEVYYKITLLNREVNQNAISILQYSERWDRNKGGACEDITPVIETSMNGLFFSMECKDPVILKKLVNEYKENFDPELSYDKAVEVLNCYVVEMDNQVVTKDLYYYSFNLGSWFGFGIPLFVLGLYVGLKETIHGTLTEGKYLFQIWAGFFLVALMSFLFGINLIGFERYGINYKLVFQFDRHVNLNPQQYLLIPSLAFGLFAILFWFSFNNYWPTQFPGRDWPWVYFGISLVVALWPGYSIYPESRCWMLVTMVRVIFSGLYKVEFRDLFLGDILTSLSYTISNITFYFCLYQHHWNGLLPGGKKTDNQCGSSKSRSMGFFSALPSIWRFLQCVRRYVDSGFKDIQHVLNMIKYGSLITTAAVLNCYRINPTIQLKIAYIAFALFGSIYSSLWDILEDWGIFNLVNYPKHGPLRKNRKFPDWCYYVAMMLDVILRFQWIFYAAFTTQIQQLAVTGFCVALAEVIRRFIWIF